MADRALQALVKQALEPEWEAKFEPNSFGFRPGRSCHDAIEAIYTSIKQKAKFALETDISRCFDQINQECIFSRLRQGQLSDFGFLSVFGEAKNSPCSFQVSQLNSSKSAA